MSAARPLDGLVVVALEAAVAAPFATRQLADLGATVVKIERPDGGDFARSYDSATGGVSSFFVWANRGKHSVVLDLREADDRATFDALVAGADVFVQNLSPAAAARLGVTAAQLRADHPGLIACDISGYGADGPRADDKAYDLAIQAEAGAIALTGTPEEAVRVGFSAADIASAMYTLTSVLAALYRRTSTGEGATIEVSMLESLAEWTAAPVYAAVGHGAVAPRAGRRHNMIAPYGLYALADGSEVLVAVQNQRDWTRFAGEVLGRPDLVDAEDFATNGRRVRNVEALGAVIGRVFDATPAEEILERLRTAPVAHARVRGPMEVWNHEQLRARDHFMHARTPAGEVEVYRPPFRIDGPLDPDPGVPSLGEHDATTIESIIERGRPDVD